MASSATRLAVAPAWMPMRMADGAAAELQHHVFAEMVEQLMHLAGMDAAGGHRHHLVEAGPVLVEEHAVLRVWPD